MTAARRGRPGARFIVRFNDGAMYAIGDRRQYARHACDLSLV
jgi:hypothetical protein